MVREQLPDARIHQFIHIPWPSASYWELLPSFMRTAICASLCQADIVGFQAERDVRSFLDSCQTFLEGATVDHQERVVRHQGHEALIRAYPISIDVEGGAPHRRLTPSAGIRASNSSVPGTADHCPSGPRRAE